ncbi:MAG: hypothetical protein WA047_03290 [Phenylobacterium sp.]|uniref:hypothetical protein n=1 Tax=Phenylobacterium sp. TaxID=1871053 RepID=UPI003BB4A6B2
MTLDIRGSLKNTKVSANQYVVFEEMISNSIDAFLIRQHESPSEIGLQIKIAVRLFVTDLLGDQLDLAVSCTDNGCGLGEKQIDAFLTKDTSYKDDLAIVGIGKCKGAGRIQFFHHFARVGLTSTYRGASGFERRQLLPTEGVKKIELADFTISPGDESEIGTTVSLDSLKPQTRATLFRPDPLAEVFSAANLRRHMLIAFLQRLVSLRTRLGEFIITFETTNPDGRIDTQTLKAEDLPEPASVYQVAIAARDPRTGDLLGVNQGFVLTHYKLDAGEFDLTRNAIALCAKSSPAQDITARYLRTGAEMNNPVADHYHLVLIEGEMLDRRVNEQRDGFWGIPEAIPTGDLFADETVSFEMLYEQIDPIIYDLVTPASWSKEAVIKDVQDMFGVIPQMLQDTETRVNYGDTAKSVAERVLKKYQDRIITETEEIFDLKQEILKSEPHSADFRAKIHELSWRYTASIKNFDMANLSQLVVRRAAIVEILALACGRQLEVQTTETGRARNEEIIHSIFFPMRKDSVEILDHDIWLLSEEYQYYDYIASDKPLSHIRWDGDGLLFDAGVDEELAKILDRRSADHKGRRPDIAIFSNEGSAIIVEFKAPGVSMDEHIGDLSEYAHLLAAKSKGRLRKFYGYLIGDTINPLRMAGWTRFATGKGYFRSDPLPDPEHGRNLGELYAEILFFEDVVDRARKRIGVYKERLKIELS